MRRPIIRTKRGVPFASSLSQTRLPEVRPYTHTEFIEKTREDFNELMTAKNFLLDKKLGKEFEDYKNQKEVANEKERKDKKI